MKKKLRSRAGETLIEVMAAILVVTLSVTMLYSLLMSATTINKRTAALSEKYSGEQNDAETRAASADGTVTVTYDSAQVSVPVEIYRSGPDALTSYSPKEAN
jgi:Tfp pilus assembly protein PilV